MKSLNNSSGFTLIEIIVVLIIVGILAAIALPNMFANVQRSKGTTAVAAMDAVKNQLEACSVQNNVNPVTPGNPCTPSGNLSNFGLPSDFSNPNNGFIYQLELLYSWPQGSLSGSVVVPSGTPSGGNMTYSFVAYDGSCAGQGSSPCNGEYGYYITYTRATDGTFTCSAPTAGPYAGVC